MKKDVLIVWFLVLAVPLFGQPIFEIDGTAMCWNINSVDSSLNRYLLIAQRTPGNPLELVYRNADGDNVTIAGGSLTYGYCECCPGAQDSIPRIEQFNEYGPVVNPFVPETLDFCYRGIRCYIYGVTNPATEISITSDAVNLTYSFNQATGYFEVETPDYGSGSGTHDLILTVTTPQGVVSRTVNFDCGT